MVFRKRITRRTRRAGKKSLRRVTRRTKRTRRAGKKTLRRRNRRMNNKGGYVRVGYYGRKYDSLDPNLQQVDGGVIPIPKFDKKGNPILSRKRQKAADKFDKEYGPEIARQKEAAKATKEKQMSQIIDKIKAVNKV